jgi:hypothetical protein
MSDYCNCNDFEKAADYNDIRYYRPEDDRSNAVKRPVCISCHGLMMALFLV